MDLEKRNNKVLKILFEKFDFIGEIGDLVVRNGHYTYVYELLNIKKRKKLEDSVLVLKRLDNDDEDEKGKNETITIQEFNREYVIFKGTYEELIQEAKDILASPDTPLEKPPTSNSTDVIQFNVATLNITKKDTETKRNRLAASIATANQMMESKLSELRKVRDVMEKQISHINKLLYTLELYQGIGEETVTLKTGKRVDDPQISILQQIMFMDVEVGDPTNGGWDIKNIEDFDKWLLKKDKYFKMKNYERLLPFPCCIAAFRIRHSDKDYDPNPFINALMNGHNDYTYFLFRNGGMLQRYWINKNIRARLFPKMDEFEKLAKDIFWDNEKAANLQFAYKLNFIILQSVVERLEIFSYMENKIQFFSPTILQNKYVNFVRNEENLIEGNTLSWSDFRDANTKLKEGERVYFINNVQRGDNKYYARERYMQYFVNEFSIPPLPDDGIYTVYKDKDENFFHIKALPSDEIYTTRREYRYSGVYQRARKKRLRFKIEDHDRFIISYDRLYHHDLETLNKMMHERKNRYYNNYLTHIPFMKNLYDIRMKEIEYDGHFVKLLQGQIDDLSTKDAEDAILWWKIKNKWKRDLKEDEPKALRMIKSYLIRNAKL